MTRHRVIRVRHELPRDSDHHLIVGLATGNDPEAAPEREWNLHQVLKAMWQGELFYVQDRISGQQAEVETYHCPLPYCDMRHLRTVPDTTIRDNLDSLPECP
ncbi:MAG TPA: hypothetical protein VF017_22465 [Thermoanaerobaculia bacterium]|nr:hypothetical protein [Thermoanaerobaculia bacterium]